MKRILLAIGGLVLVVPLLLAMVLLFWPRPEDLTPAHVFEGDAYAIDYLPCTYSPSKVVSGIAIPELNSDRSRIPEAPPYNRI